MLDMKKLPKEKRRYQLIDTAMKIVREEGTDILTLGYLASRAGVTKPIAYNHFKSRSGLLIALYAELDSWHVSTLKAAVGAAPAVLSEVAMVLSRTYFEGCKSVGEEWLAIAAALKGNAEMLQFQRDLQEKYIALYQSIFKPYSTADNAVLRLRCIGIIGAAEALSRNILCEGADFDETCVTLSGLIETWITAGEA